jgi:hypothetical protein
MVILLLSDLVLICGEVPAPHPLNWIASPEIEFCACSLDTESHDNPPQVRRRRRNDGSISE